jgi:glucose-1-phosphate adenylyltransferase
MYPRMKVFAYDFGQNYVPGEAELNRGYWRDVGTIDSYFAASLDLVAVTPLFNLYNAQWPMVSAPLNLHRRSSSLPTRSRSASESQPTRSYRTA